MPPKKKTLSDFLREADERGSVRITENDKTYYVSAPQFKDAQHASLFAGISHTDDLPKDRAAYSDRVALLMAGLSELAYTPFEKGEAEQDQLQSELTQADLCLLSTFNNPDNGTQAFLAGREGVFNVLVFRGTEMNKDDIFTDLNARFFETPEGKAHTGFITAYDSVHSVIDEALQKYGEQDGKRIPLFICGHSLGGALATVAAQELSEPHVISACYTFGSPRVGTAEWADCMKVPVYRVVNGADAVPMVPGNAFLRWVLEKIPLIPFMNWAGPALAKFTATGFVGYQHVGDMRFLYGDPQDARLKLGSAATYARLKYVVVDKLVTAVRFWQASYLKAAFSDHSIALYRKKLHTIADNRNPR